VTATAAGRSPARQDYIDWLRNLAILFLFPHHTARIFEAIMRHRLRYLAVAAAGTAGILAEIHSIRWQAGSGAAGVAFSLLHFFIYSASLLAILGYGRRYLDRKSAVALVLSPAAGAVRGAGR
jgi:hypothetical protein